MRVNIKTNIKYIFAVTALLCYSSGYGLSFVTNAELTAQANQNSLLIELSSTSTYTVFSLTKPERLVIDLKKVDKRSAEKMFSNRNLISGVNGIRIGTPLPGTTRIVLDLNNKLSQLHTSEQMLNSNKEQVLVQWAIPALNAVLKQSYKRVEPIAEASAMPAHEITKSPQRIIFDDKNYYRLNSYAQNDVASSFTVSDASSEAVNDAPTSLAPNEWSVKVTPQFTYGSYNNSPTRDSITSFGIFGEAQYLDRFGFTIGGASTDLKMKLGVPTIKQNNSFLSGKYNFTPDSLPGRLTLRADIHRATNNDATNETNGVTVIAPQVAFLSYDKSQYFDLGYARSKYGDSNIGNGSLTVTQWTPTVGVGFNKGADWLQLRAYAISVSNAARAQNKSGTDAVEAKWTHYYAFPGGLTPEKIQLSGLFGERIYAVDGDSASLYNLTDMQQGGVSVGGQWKLAEDSHLLLQSGYDRYINGTNTTYSAAYVYVGISGQW